MLEDNGLKEFVEQAIPKAAATDAHNFADWKKCVAKVRQIILEGFQDHIFSSLHGKETMHAMWKTLMDLYQNISHQRKLAIKDKLRKIKMEKGETIPKYFTKFTQCWDELGSVGIMAFKEDMVSLSLIGLLKSWHSYQDSVNGREKLPD